MTTPSKKAHEKIKESEPGMEKKILTFLKTNKATCLMVERRFVMRHETASARIATLHAKGLIKPVGEWKDQTLWHASQDNEIEAVKASVEAECFQRDLKRMKRYRHMPGFEDEIEKLKAA